jgi:AraC family transcriptional regulator
MSDLNLFRENLDDVDFYYEHHGTDKPTVLSDGWPLNGTVRTDGHSHRTRAAPRGLSRRALIQACTYMENNIGESFLLNDLAKAAGVSRFHFARLFRVSTGESPMRYLLRLRIERATEMLERGEQRICEIAAMLGFSDQSHFSRTFRRITGDSPKVFAHLQSELVQHAYRNDGGAWIKDHRTRLASVPHPSHQKQHKDTKWSTQVQFHSVGEEHNRYVAPSCISGQNS